MEQSAPVGQVLPQPLLDCLPVCRSATELRIQRTDLMPQSVGLRLPCLHRPDERRQRTAGRNRCGEPTEFRLGAGQLPLERRPAVGGAVGIQGVEGQLHGPFDDGRAQDVASMAASVAASTTSPRSSSPFAQIAFPR